MFDKSIIYQTASGLQIYFFNFILFLYNFMYQYILSDISCGRQNFARTAAPVKSVRKAFFLSQRKLSRKEKYAKK